MTEYHAKTSRLRIVAALNSCQRAHAQAWVIAEKSVDSGADIGLNFADRSRLVAEGGVAALAKVRGEEVIFGPEGPDMDEQPGLVGVADQGGRCAEPAVSAER